MLAEVPSQLVEFFTVMKLKPPTSQPAANPAGTVWAYREGEQTQTTLTSCTFKSDPSFLQFIDQGSLSDFITRKKKTLQPVGQIVFFFLNMMQFCSIHGASSSD